MERTGIRRDFIDEDVIRCGLILLCDQPYLRRHGGGHGRAEDIALGEPCPLAVVVNGVNERQLILAVERFGNGTGLRLDQPQTIGGEVRAVGRIHADHGQSPPSRQTKTPPVSDGAVAYHLSIVESNCGYLLRFPFVPDMNTL